VNYEQRKAALEAERKQIERESVAKRAELRKALAAHMKAKQSAIAALEARAAEFELDALTAFRREVFGRLLLRVTEGERLVAEGALRTLHREPSNAAALALIATIGELDALALDAIGKEFSMRYLVLALGALHVDEGRTGVAARLVNEGTWRAQDVGPGGVLELGGKLIKACREGDVLGVRKAFDLLDGLMYSWRGSASPDALETFRATLEPDPRVLRAREAELELRALDSERAATEAANLAAVRHGMTRLGWPEVAGVSYSA